MTSLHSVAISVVVPQSGGSGADTLHFNNISVDATSLTGGAGADLLTGGISVGSSGVSFWGGAGADTFNFSTGISNASGTAYFWNADTGVDSINLGAATAVTQNLGFGVSTGSGLIVNFGDTSNGFASNSTNLFTFTGTATGGLVTYSSTTTSTIFMDAGGSTITFMGGAGLSASFYNAGFTPLLVLLRLQSLVATAPSRPSADPSSRNPQLFTQAPSQEGAFLCIFRIVGCWCGDWVFP